jgi:beta-mannosidase
VERLRSHASLIMWCGGNESLEGFQHWGWPEQLQGKAWGELYYQTLLPEIVEELDSTRPYIPGSPFSTHNEDVKSFNSGTNHIWDVWNDLGYERYEEYSPAFCAEFGYSGPGSYSMLSQSIGKPLLDSKDTDLAIHQKALNGMAKLAAGLQREFRNPPTAGIPWYFATALVQARAVEVGLKHFRSNYETCSGTILWQFNDMWPAISWSALDHTGFRKLAWHAMQGAYKPRSIFIGRIDHGGKFTILNDSNEPWIGSAVVTLMNSSGIIQLEVTIAISLDPYSLHRELLADHFPQILFNDFDGFLHARVNDLSTARRTILAPAWKAPWHDLTITSELVAESLIVTITANTYIHELCLLPELISIGTNVDSQLISLLPGETHTFIILGLPGSLKEIQDSLADIVWSHNRIVNEKYIN